MDFYVPARPECNLQMDFYVRTRPGTRKSRSDRVGTVGHPDRLPRLILFERSIVVDLFEETLRGS